MFLISYTKLNSLKPTREPLKVFPLVAGVEFPRRQLVRLSTN